MGEKYLRDIKNKEEFPQRVLDSIEALAEFLVNEARTMERGSEQAKKEAKEQVPGDRIKDASALSRELRWRIKLAAGHLSDDEGLSRRGTKIAVNGHTDGKRKRYAPETIEGPSAAFKNYKPRVWESVVRNPVESEKRMVKARRPLEDEGVWAKDWMDWREELTEVDDGEEVDVNSRRDVVIKVRRTANGVERQRVERVIEEWSWSDDTLTSSSLSEGAGQVKMEVDELVDTNAMDVKM